MGVRLAGGQASSIDDDKYGQLFEVIIGFNGVQTEIHLIGP
jgi:hypothetical protein